MLRGASRSHGPDRRVLRRPAGQPGRSIRTAGALVLFALLFGCDIGNDPPGPPPGPSPFVARAIRSRTELPDPHPEVARQEQTVAEACIRCHLRPPPDALPREAWAGQILAMTQLPARTDVEMLTPKEAADAIAWYEAHAPTDWSIPAAVSDPEPPSYRVAEFTPAGLEGERIPAVSFLLPTPPDSRGAPGLLVCEMRSRTILRLPIGAQVPSDLALDSPRWNYPVHIAHADLDGDGRLDRIVAGIGGMNPTRDELGGVQVLFSSGGPPRGVGVPRLARVSDADAADLDGDGDLDLVVAAFGWRGEGRLVWLERTGAATFVLHEIDPRDGFIHVFPIDLDDDGDLDILTAVAQEFEEVVCFRNDGGGTFTPVIIEQGPHPSWGTSGLDVADIDGDGDSDVLVSHGDTLDLPVVKPYHGVRWLENQGDFRFEAHPIGSLPGCERAIARDADGDGDLDVVAVAFLPQVDPEEWRRHALDSVVLFERRGEGWVRHSLEKGNPLHPSVEVLDLDGDGDPDIAVGNYIWMDEGARPRQRREYLTVFYRE